MPSAVTDLRVSLVQTALHWHNPEANRQHLQEQWRELKGKTDLIVLPEMFTSGFTAHPEAMDKDGVTLAWLIEQSRKLDVAITGSIACHVNSEVEEVVGKKVGEDAPAFVNRLLFVMPSGDYHYYDKVHLFRMGDEHRRYQPGSQRKVITYRHWRILLTICYDLRFPVFCRNRNDYDLMLCVANWPASRREHWRSLLVARAIENQACVVGVNRTGTDGNKLAYAGDSLAIDAQGKLLVDEPGDWLRTCCFSLSELNHYRERFPAWQDADSFTLECQ